MPVFEPSTDINQKQAQLAAILVPVLVMLGGMGISYGIYTALRWFSSSNRQDLRNRTESSLDSEAMAQTNDPEKLMTVQPDAQPLSHHSSCTTTSAPPILVIGSDALLASITPSGKRTGMALVVSSSIPAKGKENMNPHMPKQPSPLKNGYKPDGPEPGIHPLHGYHYF